MAVFDAAAKSAGRLDSLRKPVEALKKEALAAAAKSEQQSRSKVSVEASGNATSRAITNAEEIGSPTNFEDAAAATAAAVASAGATDGAKDAEPQSPIGNSETTATASAAAVAAAVGATAEDEEDPMGAAVNGKRQLLTLAVEAEDLRTVGRALEALVRSAQAAGAAGKPSKQIFPAR